MPKIMLVEDDATMLSLLQTLLQMEGYQVVKMIDESLDGILSTFRQEKPDLALIDVHLRELNGFRRAAQDPQRYGAGQDTRGHVFGYGMPQRNASIMEPMISF